MSKLNKSKMGGPTDTSCSVSSARSSCAVVSSISKPFREVTLGSLSCEIYLKVGHLLLHAENLSPDRLACHQSVTHIFQIKTIWQSHGLPICQSFFFHKMIVPLVNVFATSKTTCFCQKNWKTPLLFSTGSFRTQAHSSPGVCCETPACCPTWSKTQGIYFLLFILGFNRVARLYLVVHVKTDVQFIVFTSWI